MTKLAASVLSLVIGLVIGFLAGFVLLGQRATSPPVEDARHFYYQLNDSTIVRHTITGSGAGVKHTVDTLAVQTR